ncbi:MAG: hypothetical protein ABII80_02595 [bacterium]
MQTKKFIIKIDPSLLVPSNVLRKYYLLAIGMAVAMLLIIVGFWKHLPMSVPLFFTAPWGEARLAPKIFLLLLPISGFLVIVVNLILAKIAQDEAKLLTEVLVIGAMMIEVMLTISLIGIVQSVV